MKNKLFQTDDYLYVHETVLKFKETNDPMYAEIILDKFSLVIEKVVNLVSRGRCSPKDKIPLNILSLYTPSGLSSASKGFAPDGKLGPVVLESRDRLLDLCSGLSEDDVRQIARLTLLHMVNLYKDVKPSFHTYVLRTYHFNFYRQISKWTRDPLSRANYIETFANENESKYNYAISCTDNIEEIDMTIDIENASVYKDTTKSGTINIYEDDCFDVNWLEGHTCGDIFKCLNPFERRILYLWVVEKKTDKEIGDMFGYYRGTIFNKRKKAKQKLFEARDNIRKTDSY